MITLTENAAKKVHDLMGSREQTTGGLRVGVRGGGCSGFSYFLEFAEASADGDRELESHGVTLFIDRKSYLYLMGTEVDYIDALHESGFRFSNPNAKRTCGCGESFSV